MTHQLRRYRLRPGSTDEFVEVWRDLVVPLRQRLGFEVVAAWTVPGADEFVWVVSHPGDFEEAERRYYDSPERAALDPDPGSFIESAETVAMTPVA